jgi:hypothetical protein
MVYLDFSLITKEIENMRLDDVEYLMQQVLSIKDDLEGRDESTENPETVTPPAMAPAASVDVENYEPALLHGIDASHDDEEDDEDDEWDEEDELDVEEDQDEEDEDDEDDEHPAMKFLDACLELDLVRSRNGRLKGAILLRTTGGPHIEVFTEQRLIVGSWGGCPPVAVSYCDRIGLEDYILECFSHYDR